MIMAFQIILFLALVQVLKRIFWNPVLGHIEDRNKEIESRYTERDRLEKEMSRLRTEYNQRIAAVEADARIHIQEAIKSAQVEREKLIADARSEANAALEAGKQEAELDRVKTLLTLQASIEQAVAHVASATLGNDVNQTLIQNTIHQYVAQQVVNPTA